MVALFSERVFFDTAPAVRRISAADLRWALAEGWRDFKDMRGDVLALAFVYPVGGILASLLLLNESLAPLMFPLVAGLAILGPAVASGFFELARRRDAGEEAGWSHFLDPFRRASRDPLMALSLMLAVLFSAWIAAAWALYSVTVGPAAPASAAELFRLALTTPAGWTLIVAGGLIGFVFAAVTLVVSLVSFPMVVDRRADALTAVAASLRACARNPGPVAAWGLTIAVVLTIACIPLFAGLVVALPVLGYASWRLYTRLVEH